MKGLILKDILNLKKQAKTSLTIIVVYFIVFSYIFKDYSFSMTVGMISGMFTMVLAMLSISTFSCDDAAKWDIYALCLPLDRKYIVFSKYILAIGLCITGTIITILLSFVVKLFRESANISLDDMIGIYVVFAMSIFYISVIIPIIYKFGADRTRLLMVLVFIVPFFLIYLGINTLSNLGVSMPSEQTLTLLLILSPIFLIAVLSLSILLSYRIYITKEF